MNESEFQRCEFVEVGMPDSLMLIAFSLLATRSLGRPALGLCVAAGLSNGFSSLLASRVLELVGEARFMCRVFLARL